MQVREAAPTRLEPAFGLVVQLKIGRAADQLADHYFFRAIADLRTCTRTRSTRPTPTLSLTALSTRQAPTKSCLSSSSLEEVTHILGTVLNNYIEHAFARARAPQDLLLCLAAAHRCGRTTARLRMQIRAPFVIGGQIRPARGESSSVCVDGV